MSSCQLENNAVQLGRNKSKVGQRDDDHDDSDDDLDNDGGGKSSYQFERTMMFSWDETNQRSRQTSK